MPAPDQDKFDAIAEEYDWAVGILRNHISEGLAYLCDPKFLGKRYKDFKKKADPIYGRLLEGMNDEPLAKTFVSYWTIAHTLATQSRFWLEDAVADIILHQVRQRQRELAMVFSAKMLGAGYFAQRKCVAELGEDALEHLSSRSPWRVPMSPRLLSEIDTMVGEQEQESPPERKPFQAREWTDEGNERAVAKDASLRKKIDGALGQGGEPSEISLQCNLLVVDPEKTEGAPSVQAIRFVNPKTLSNHAARKQERVNLLRLYGYLIQEKVYHKSPAINVCVAELLPRHGHFDHSDRYPDYFSTATYWSCKKLWKFIGVPYEVVSIAIEREAKEFRDRLIEGLRGLLPEPE